MGQAAGGVGDLIKIPPILSDLVVGCLVWSMVRELGGRDRLALIGALVAVLNPISWFNSVVWGQVDSFGVIFVLLALRDLWRDRPERAAVWTVIAAIIKPQLGILIPLVAVVTIRRALWPVRDATVVEHDGDGDIDGDADGDGTAATDPAGTGWRDRFLAWERRTDSPWRILTTGVAAFATAVVLCLPFGLSVIGFSSEPPFVESGLIDQVIVAGGGYPYLTVNAYNAWALVPGDTGITLASTGQWVCDAAQPDPDRCGAGIASFGPVPAVVVGDGLLVASFVLDPVVRGAVPGSADAARRLGRARPGVLRRAYARPRALRVPVLRPRRDPVRGLDPLAMGVRGALARDVPEHVRRPHDAVSGQPQRRGLARHRRRDPRRRRASPSSRSCIRARSCGRCSSSAPIAAPPWNARSPRRRHRSDRRRTPSTAAGSSGSRPRGAALGAMATTGDLDASPSGGGMSVLAGASGVAMPTWSPRPTFAELGFVGWFRDRLGAIPIRPDRSASLVGERGGRFDRLDLWLLIVLVVASLGLRTFRLAEPLQMHFDEVYHARTATEFLQDWRYGLSHDIYEWTHPHLAKYAMAAGIVLWGEDHVSGLSDLGVPVRAAVVEPRRDGLDGERAGERVHVATGDAIRTYDVRTRALISTIQAPGAARWPSTRPRRGSSSGPTTAASRPSTSTRSASGASTSG